MQPDLSGNPFYATKWSEKIGSGRRIKLPKPNKVVRHSQIKNLAVKKQTRFSSYQNKIKFLIK